MLFCGATVAPVERASLVKTDVEALDGEGYWTSWS